MYRGTNIMGLKRQMSIIAMIMTCTALASCKSDVEFSQAPFSSEDKSEIRPLKTVVFADLPIDLTKFKSRLDNTFPEDILTTKSWLSKAACFERRGRKICQSALSRIKIKRAGDIKLAPYDGGIAAYLPLKAAFTASGQGRAKSIGDAVNEKFSLRITFDVSLNKTWEVQVALREATLANDPVPVKLLGKTIKYKKPLEKKIMRLVRHLPSRLRSVMEGEALQDLAAKSWRRLYDPIQISAEPEIWIRGRPISVSFGGFAIDNRRITARLAINTSMSTSVHDRPVPLMPSPLPSLTASGPGDQKSHMNYSIPISYDELSPAIQKAVVTDKINIGDDENEILVHASHEKLYPSGHYLAMELNIETDVEDEWFAQKGTLYITASPWYNAASASLTLNNVAITQPKTNPKFFRDGTFLFQKSPYSRQIEKSINLALASRFEKTLTHVNGLMNRQVGKDLWLTGRFMEIGVSSISPRNRHLQLNLKLRGALSLRTTPPEKTTTEPTEMSAASLD